MVEKNVIIGTAGHIDHGKTTLIKALTGIDTDRLTEEKKRGISIDLGFTKLILSDGKKVGIVDVPGHERFIKNMLAGAGGVDLALLVIAADEGFMPQTEEHLAILDLLKVKVGIVVITKIDQVEDEWLNLVSEDVREHIKDTFLADAPILPVSATQGTGIDRLKEKIEEMIDLIPVKDDRANLYLPIDRVFTIAGHGTIITGTLIKGMLKLGDEFRVYPEGIDVRVRSIQVYNQQVKRALPGQRVGINLAGVDKEKIKRGDVLATVGSLVETEYLDARLKLLPNTSVILNHGDRIRFYIGAKEILGRVYLLDKEKIYPGENGLVQFRLEEKLVANYQERYIIRRYSPMITIGGGEIIETNPNRHRRFDEKINEALRIKISGSLPDRVELSLKLESKQPLLLKDLIIKTGLAENQLKKILSDLEEERRIIKFRGGQNSTWVHQENYVLLQEEIRVYLKDFHRKYHLKQGVAQEELRTKLSMKLNNNEYMCLIDDLRVKGEIKVINSRLSLVGFKIKFKPEEEAIKERIINLYLENKFNPPDFKQLLEEFNNHELLKEVFNALLVTDELIKIAEGLYFHPLAIKEAKELLKDYLKANKSIELGQYRDLLASSRKYVLPLLEYFDNIGITERKDKIRKLKDISIDSY